MTEQIKSISLGLGASIVLPVVAMTGIAGRIRSPFPEAQASIMPADGSVFVAEVAEGGIRITGIAEGEGVLTLIAGPNPSQRTTYRVFVEAVNNTTRWVFGYGGVVTEGTVMYPAMDLQVDTSSDPTIAVSWSGDGAELEVAVDWGDGVTETVPAGQGNATHEYTGNGDYIFTADPVPSNPDVTYQTASADVSVSNVTTPLEFTVDVNADPLATLAVTSPVSTITIDWGDGTVDADVDPTDASHMYAEDGTFTVTVSTTDPLYTDATAEAAIANATVGGVSSPPADAVSYGPFDIPSIQTFWVYTSASVPDWFSAAVNVDADPEPDLQIFGPQLAAALRDFPTEAVSGAIAKVREVWGR